MTYKILQHIVHPNIKTIAKVIIKVIEFGDYTIITSDDLTHVSAIFDFQWKQINADITASPDGSMIIFDKKDFLDYFWKLPGNYVELIVGFDIRKSKDDRIIYKL